MVPSRVSKAENQTIKLKPEIIMSTCVKFNLQPKDKLKENKEKHSKEKILMLFPNFKLGNE